MALGGGVSRCGRISRSTWSSLVFFSWVLVSGPRKGMCERPARPAMVRASWGLSGRPLPPTSPNRKRALDFSERFEIHRDSIQAGALQIPLKLRLDIERHFGNRRAPWEWLSG